MEPLGGFPPLILKDNINREKNKEQKTVAPQYFSDSMRKNINIREILSSQAKPNLDLTETKLDLEEVDDF